MRHFVLSFHLNSDGCFMTYAGQRWLSRPLCDVTYGTSTWTRNSWAAAAVVQDQKRRRRRRRSFGCLRTFPCKSLGFFFMFPHFSAFSEGVLSVYLFRNSHYVDEPMLRYEAVSPMWCGGSREVYSITASCLCSITRAWRTQVPDKLRCSCMWTKNIKLIL